MQSDTLKKNFVTSILFHRFFIGFFLLDLKKSHNSLYIISIALLKKYTVSGNVKISY